MKVIAFCGSPRKESNTEMMVNEVFNVLESEGIDTEFISLRNSKLRGCMACYKCFENDDHKCVIKGDKLNEYVEKMKAADGIILASPVYFAAVTAEMKAFIDRAGFAAFADKGSLRHKVGAAIAVARRIGFCQTLQQMNTFFSAFEMFQAHSSYPTMAIGEESGTVMQDEMGIQTMRDLGKNMAFLLKKLNS